MLTFVGTLQAQPQAPSQARIERSHSDIPKGSAPRGPADKPWQQVSDFLRHMYMELDANSSGSSLYPRETQSALEIYQVLNAHGLCTLSLSHELPRHRSHAQISSWYVFSREQVHLTNNGKEAGLVFRHSIKIPFVLVRQALLHLVKDLHRSYRAALLKAAWCCAGVCAGGAQHAACCGSGRCGGQFRGPSKVAGHDIGTAQTDADLGKGPSRISACHQAGSAPPQSAACIGDCQAGSLCHAGEACSLFVRFVSFFRCAPVHQLEVTL